MKYHSLSNDVKRVKYMEQMQESELNKLIHNIGHEIQDNIADPYKYLMKRNFSIEDRTKTRLNLGSQKRPVGSMSIAEIWTKKMKKQCDKILEDMKKKQDRQILDLSKQQSMDDRKYEVENSNPGNVEQQHEIALNVTKMMEQFGFKALIGKKNKNKGSMHKLQSILTSQQQPLQSQSQIQSTVQSPEQIRNRFVSNFQFEPINYSPIKQYHHNSQSTSSSTKNLYNVIIIIIESIAILEDIVLIMKLREKLINASIIVIL